MPQACCASQVVAIYTYKQPVLIPVLKVQLLFERHLAHDDEALESDPSFSGMSPRFVEETWVNWLPKAVAKPFYRDQLTSHVAELERQISNLCREIELQSGGLLDQRDAAVDLRQRLKHLLETS